MADQFHQDQMANDTALIDEAMDLVAELQAATSGDGLVHRIRVYEEGAMVRERQNAERYESTNGSPATYLHQHLDEAVEIMRRFDQSMTRLVDLAYEDYKNAMVVDGEKRAQYTDNVITSTAAYDQILSNLFDIMNWEARRAHRVESLHTQEIVLEDAVAQAQSQLEQIPDNLPAHGMYQRWMQRLYDLLDGIRVQIEADTEIVRRLALGRQAARRMEMELAKDPAVTFHDSIAEKLST
ncbi:hypothetical protein LEN26_008825 [Aphanomyces euteiches]|nr:hypothetical protein AeMF1_013296 [Aphanomyces euteiches]KAH9130121.1 hypothetical protein LEN26_008825 [Aphanomyces euteiches]